MSLSSLNSIGQSMFDLESGNGNVDGQTDKKRTNERTELHQFRKQLVTRYPTKDGVFVVIP